MQPDEDLNFLRFATALKIMVGSAIWMDKVTRAKTLLEEYLLGYSNLYGANEMKPNHHWAVHIPDQILDYGPVYTFWAFLSERLNKFLKNLNSNNWTGGRLEVSMMREFHQSSGVEGVMKSIAEDNSRSGLEHDFIRTLLSTGNSHALGTIQDAAQGSKQLFNVWCQPGSIFKKAEPLNDVVRFALHQYYNQDRPQVHLRREEVPGTQLLRGYGEIYNYMLLDVRRIIPITAARTSGGSSIIQARFGNEAQAGEIHSIFVHRQPGVVNSASTLLALIGWMKNSPYTPLYKTTLWDAFPELGINTWEFNTFLDPHSAELPMIIRVEDIHCQVARGVITHTTPKLWITTTMDRVSTHIPCH
ncbi:hypothetical protein DFH07DRAFT_756569 [Mycena maculata]|uniref:Uncharacterized protein n=1 Tax=Mycena maculata TaxID=230809 RepID=A0AAD7HWC7_9AGAR|nr:hypothetical protein DFH07DRAFT_756569 [Mycena maculata]